MKNLFVKLSDEQLDIKLQFIKSYLESENAATASLVDANANVSAKNIATLNSEINKDISLQINRYILYKKIEEMFGKNDADEYIRQLEAHELYCHDETSLMPYCASISMYPFLIDGLTKIGGESRAPKHLSSFCGGFVNLVFAVSSQFAGAVSTPEWLMYFDYFCSIEFGDDYLITHSEIVRNSLQHCVYALNQPAAARGYQAVFWNIAIFDDYYLKSLFEGFRFPDGSEPKWENIKKLQAFFMEWFNQERTKSLLTFPVVTANMLIKDNKPKDENFADMVAKELSEGNSFFIYQSESVDSLSSCCRLRNELSDNTFSYTLGAGGVATGSINVMTLNVNRLIQHNKDIAQEVQKVHKYQVAYRQIMEEYKNSGALTIYDAGFINLDKQFLTIGINGLVEAAESLGIRPINNNTYRGFVESILKPIYELNKEARKKYGYMFNTEFVPAENLGVKNAAWDKKDGLTVKRDCYNSYFYAVEDADVNLLDKFILHGRDFVKYLDGGSALHLNLEEYPSKEGFLKLLNTAAVAGTNYFCFNIKVTICNHCGHIDKHTNFKCSKCASHNIDHAVRVIGYLKRIKSFSAARQKEESQRRYTKINSLN
jgi:ribonucleoside-triphosphate reductase